MMAFKDEKCGTTHHAGCACHEARHKADIDRKNKLLKEALEQLLVCEWFVSLSVIVAIEKELGIVEDLDNF
jgi:protein-arginine kinase activator protein McsA